MYFLFVIVALAALATTIQASTDAPTFAPTVAPTEAPTAAPTVAPTQYPTSMPTYTADGYQKVWDKKRSRTSGFCDNSCSGNGICQLNVNCKCFKGADGEYQWTGADCSLRTCPKSNAWVAVYYDAVNTASIKNNDLHPSVECSNKGKCDRSSGICQCYPGYEGIACQRTVCPNNCNDRGKCLPQKVLAARAGTEYSTPWDNVKHVGCYCDVGYRGPACELQECPTGQDPLGGYGNETGRDCSGRGKCNYQTGVCECFGNFFGTNCGQQSTVA